MEGETPPRAGILTCWKEIAAFFHRDVRTVQRWEREQGLPVHRHAHQRRSSVYAYPDELEAWWSHYQASDRAVGDCIDPATVVARQPLPQSANASMIPIVRDVHPPRWRVRWAWAAALLCGALVGAAGLFLFAYGSDEDGSYPLRDFATVASRAPLQIRSFDDLNGDGRGDLVVSPSLGHETLVYFGASQGTSTAPDVRITYDTTGYPTGGSVGDVDGDGLPDLLVNALLAEPAGFTATGSSYLIKGRRDWPKTIRLPEDADSEFYVALRTDIRMNSCIIPGGLDLNEDGLRDVLLGGGDYSPPGRPSAGGVFVLFGRRDWPRRIDVVAAADVTVHGSRAGEALRADCDAGDFNADGHADLALIASEDTLWRLQGGRGRVYVFAGGPAWPKLLDANRDATMRVQGHSPGATSTRPLLTDVNGDKVADLVAAFGDPETRTRGGRVSIVFGSQERRGVVDELAADLLLTGGPTFGTSVWTADVNVDGCNDVMITEPEAGAVHLVLGHAGPGAADSIKRTTPLRLVAGARGTGASGVAVGDRDADGAPDLVLEMGTATADGLHRIVHVSPALPIAIDVRPGDTPNVLLPQGVLAVEVLTPSLVHDIDAPSLRLAGVAPSQLAWQDFDFNGSLELRLFFDAARLTLPVGSTRVALRGRTRSGLPLAGSDDIVVVTPDQGRR